MAEFIQYSSECYSIFASILDSRSNNSTPNHHLWLCLLFNLCYRGLLFALRTNLESGPWFAEVCLQSFYYLEQATKIAVKRVKLRKTKYYFLWEWFDFGRDLAIWQINYSGQFIKATAKRTLAYFIGLISIGPIM